jgi:hypothetical protein
MKLMSCMHGKDWDIIPGPGTCISVLDGLLSTAAANCLVT